MVVDDAHIPRVLLSQGLYIQSLFLLKSSETHMTSHELVSEGLIYACLEIVSETFCFYIFTFAFIWYRISGLSTCKGQKQSHSRAYTLRKPELKETRAPQCSL